MLRDDPVWTNAADHFLNETCTADTPGFINSVVLVEVVWTLLRQGRDDARIRIFLYGLLNADNIVLADRKAVELALALFEKSKAGFADCLIAAINHHAGVEMTYTIDRDAAELPGFSQLRK